jgi:putative DNA primase/helicase
MEKDGLYFRKDDDPSPAFVAAPFKVVAETCDESGNGWGVLLRWKDRDNRPHQWAMPRRLVHADGNTIAAELEDAGLTCAATRTAHEKLKSFFGGVTVKRRVRCVDRAGWHQTDAGPVFVLPNGEALGPARDALVFQSERAGASETFSTRGSLAEWQENVARYAVGNYRLALSLSTSFAGPLLDITGEPSGGLHVIGKSRTGKTALLHAAASVWGIDDCNGQLRTWRATANGLEGVAARYSDGVLILDEMGEADARAASEIVYLLANETGKSRADRSGAARRRRTWRVLFLSSGEVTLQAKLAEAGLRPMAGQHVRLVNIGSDAGAGLGVFQNLHGLPHGAALSDHLRNAARTFCGTAGPAFLRALAHDRADDPAALNDALKKLRARFIAEHLPDGADGQVRSVAGRFALIGAAGELAQTYGVLPWPEDEAIGAAGACFKAWLAERGGAGATEDMRAIEAVRSFIAAHGASRFEVVAEASNGADQRIINRAGFKQANGEGWDYLILPDTWGGRSVPRPRSEAGRRRAEAARMAAGR